MKLGSKPLTLVGLTFALVAVVGYVALGWRFGDGNQLTFVVGALVATLALGTTLREHFQ